MSSHLSGIDGLLGDPGSFDLPREVGQRAAFALEFLNAHAHLPRRLRSLFPTRGGTPAQLLLPGGLQRLSRDLDMFQLGSQADCEEMLSRIAERYDGKLFGWREIKVAAPRIPMLRYGLEFPTLDGRSEELVADVVAVPVDLPTASVGLATSGVYRPRDPDDAIETLTKEAFFADKLPTLGFDTHGYPRPAYAVVPMDEHPEHVWKQVHDLGGLASLGLDIADVLMLYARGIAARDRARKAAHGTARCLDDAWRVCRIAFGALAGHPDQDEADAAYFDDVLHVGSGIARYQQYAIGHVIPRHHLAPLARTAAVVALLRALEARSITAAEATAITHRLDALVPEITADPRRHPVARRFRERGAVTWHWPDVAGRVFSLSPEAAIYAVIADDVVAQAAALRSGGKFSIEA